MRKQNYIIGLLVSIIITLFAYHFYLGPQIQVDKPYSGTTHYSSNQIDIITKGAVIINSYQTVFEIFAKSLTPSIEIVNKSDSTKNMVLVLKNIDAENSDIDTTGKADIKKLKNIILFKLELNKDIASKIKIFPKKENKKFTFAVIGDTRGSESPFTNKRGSYFIYRQFKKEINAINPAFWINLGDMVNSGHPYQYRRFREQLKNISSPLFPVIGNHEFVDPVGEKYFKALFGNANYSFNYGDCHFIIIDNSKGVFTNEDFKWLERDIDENMRKQTIIFMHKPIFDPRPGENHVMENRENAWHLEEIFLRKKIKYVFTGHIHGYYNETRKGIKYYITAGGGAKLVSDESFYHYLLVKVDGKKVDVEVRKLQPPFIFKIIN